MSPPFTRRSSLIQSLSFLPSRSPGGADADARHEFVVFVRGVEILLPAGLRGLAHDADVQRIVAAAFEDEVETGGGDLQRVATVALGEEQAVEGCAGGDGVPFLRA